MANITKSLEISAKLDLSQTTAAVDDLKRRLEGVASSVNTMKGHAQASSRLSQQGYGGLSASRPEDIQKSRRELDLLIKEQRRGQEALAIQIQNQVDKEKKLLEIIKNKKAGSKEVVQEEEKLLQVKKNQLGFEKESLRVQTIIKESLRLQGSDNRLGIIGGGGGSDIGPPSPNAVSGGFGPMGRAGGTQRNWAGTAGAMAMGLPSAMIGAAKIIDHLAEFNQRFEAARGAAIEGATGRDLTSIYAGRTPFEAAWMPEREKASGLSEQKKEWNRMTDKVTSAASGILTVGGAIIALGTGFTGIGAAAGMAMASAGIAMQANDRTRLAFKGGPEYEQLLAAEQVKDFWNNLENFKKQDQKKKLTMEHFEQNYMKDLQAQRTLGLSNEGFYGDEGLLSRGKRAGFTREMTSEMAQSIVGAGGSARMGQQGQFGLQMQRGGLTNASQLLGTLSGSMQAPEASKSAIISIMSEAFKRGLDTSDYVEETRRFTQAATEVIGRTGAVTGQGQDRLSEMFGMFLGERTNAGVQSARGAYEEFQQRGSQVGGRRGVMRYSLAQQNANLSKLDPMDLTELLAMKPEDLQSSPSVLAYYTQQAGYQNSGDLLRDLSNVQKKTRFQVPGVRNKVEEYAEKVAKYMKDQGMTQTELFQRARQGQGGGGIFGGRGGLPPDILSAVGGLGIKTNLEEQGGYNETLAFARAGEQLRNTGILPETALDKTKAQDILAGPSGRVEDDYVSAIARSADLVRTNFNELKTAITKAVDATDGLANATSTGASRQRNANEQRRSSLPSGDPYQREAKAATQGQATSAPSTGKGYKER